MRRLVLASLASFHSLRQGLLAATRGRCANSWACCRVWSIVGLVSVASVADAATIELVSTTVSPQNLSLVYEAETGRLTVDAPEGAPLTAIEVRSSAGRFTKTCEGLGGPFDVCSTSKVFKMDVAGFDRVDLGAVLPQNLTVDDLKGDLVIDGATAGGGFDQGQGTLLVHRGIAIPEPSSLTLGLLSFLGCWSLARRR